METQRSVPWAESVAAGRAVEIGALQLQRPQNRLKGLASPVHIARLSPAGAVPPSAGVVGPVCVQMQLQGSRGQAQGATSGRGFPGLEIDLLSRIRSDQALDLLPDFVLEACLDPPFLAASAVWVEVPSTSSSAHCSQTFQ